ncbi:MAG: HEPN domain-containing protein, partial [Terriglobales bacterium]
VAQHERDYVRWQNRAVRFYLAARLLHGNQLYAPAAYSAAIAIELLLKATLVYCDRSFDPLAAGHGMAKLCRMVRNKMHGAQSFTIPDYFYHEQRYLKTSRYPNGDNGLGIPAEFLVDLDRVFVELLPLVPFQHNTEIKRALRGKDKNMLLALRRRNPYMRRLRATLGVSLT